MSRAAAVNRTIAATGAAPPRTGVRRVVNPKTRWYAASTGTPRMLDMLRTALPAGTDEVLEAAAISPYLRGDDPPNPRAFGGRGQREVAAAGAAEGALGLVRPAASGSRWRKNAARQDFSR